MNHEWDLIVHSLQWALQCEDIDSPAQKSKNLQYNLAQIDIEKLCKISLRHRVLSIVHTYLTRSEQLELIPNFQKLTHQHQLLQRQSLKKIAHLLKISEILNTAGIPFFVLKGPLLSKLLYNNANMRMCVDIDLFIQQHNLKKASEALERALYRRTPPIVFDDKSTDFIRGDHHLCFYTPDQSLSIELHFKLMPRPFIYRVDWETLWNRKETVQIHNTNFYSLSPQDNLAYLCGHGHKHGWSRINWLLDFARLYIRHFRDNPETARHCIVHYNLKNEFFTALMYAQEIFTASPPLCTRNDKEIPSNYSYLRQQIDWFQKRTSEDKLVGSFQMFRYFIRTNRTKLLDTLTYLKFLRYSRWVTLKKPLGVYTLWLLLGVPAFVTQQLRSRITDLGNTPQ